MTWLYGAVAALGLLIVAAVVFIAITWAIYEARTKGARPLGAPKAPSQPTSPAGANLDLSGRLSIRAQLERELGSLEILPSEVWAGAPKEDHVEPEASEGLLVRWPEFMEEVKKRMEKGRTVYGDRSIRRPPAELRGEIAEELLDVLGWAYWIWVRVQDLEVGGDTKDDPFAGSQDKFLEAQYNVETADSQVAPEGQEVRP